MAAAVIAKRIAALPPHERGNLTERSGSFYTSKPHEEQQAEELQKEFYEEVCFWLLSNIAVIAMAHFFEIGFTPSLG
jgi:hypothetical protein